MPEILNSPEEVVAEPRRVFKLDPTAYSRMREELQNAPKAGEPALAPEADITFEQAARKRRRFSDEFIVKALNQELEVAPGDKATFVKLYFDQVPADTKDKEIAKSPDKIADFHDQLSTFIQHNMKLLTHSVESKDTDYLDRKKEKYVSRLEENKQIGRTYLHALASWEGRDKNPKGRPHFPHDVFQLPGYYVPIKDQNIDLTEKSLSNVRSNVTVQRGIVGSFVMYTSDEYIDGRFGGRESDLELTKRIYLNPSIEQSVPIFESVVTAANQSGLVMKGKIWDRASECINRLKRPESDFGMRGDGIVLYAGKDASELLSLVEKIYKDNPKAFEGREVSKVPFKIGQGFALGDEPNVSGESLTSHRSGIVETALYQTQERLGTKYEKTPSAQEPKAIAVFNERFRVLATQAGVNPDNMAFNL